MSDGSWAESTTPFVPPRALIPALEEFLLWLIDQFDEIDLENPEDYSTPTETRLVEIAKRLIDPAQEALAVLATAMENVEVDDEALGKVFEALFSALAKMSTIVDEAEVLLFAEPFRDGLDTIENTTNVGDALIAIILWMSYRAIRIDACMNGTTVDFEIAQLAAMSPSEAKQLEDDMKAKGLWNGYIETYTNLIQQVVPKRLAEQQEDSALIVPFTGKPHG
jgi:hypothetical protein